MKTLYTLSLIGITTILLSQKPYPANEEKVLHELNAIEHLELVNNTFNKVDGWSGKQILSYDYTLDSSTTYRYIKQEGIYEPSIRTHYIYEENRKIKLNYYYFPETDHGRRIVMKSMSLRKMDNSV